jgi:two-component system, NtrC family, sensor histidine kinase PilS
MDRYSRDENDLYCKLRSLIVARLLVGTTLLIGVAIPLEITGISEATSFLFPLITAILLLTILHSGLLNIVKNQRITANMQLIGDMILSGFVIMRTGGLESPFTILLAIIIIVGSYILESKGLFTITICASLFFGFIVISQYQGWTNWWPVKTQAVLLPPPAFAGYVIVVNLIGFYLIALLANKLSERVRKMNILLKNKNIQFSYLWTLNRRIVNEIHSGLITLTHDGEILSSNPSVKRMLGISDESTIPSRLDDLFPAYLVQSIMRIAELDSPSKQAIHYQLQNLDKTVWLLIEVVILKKKALDPARLLLILTDISERKKLEDIRRKTQRWNTVSEISAGMAHEIRNPLASIIGSIEVLCGQVKLTDSQARLMDIVIRESDRLNKLMTNFLDLSKPMTPDFSLVDVKKTLEDIVVVVNTSRNGYETIEVRVDISEGLPDIELDKDQFSQVVWNLVKNAIEAMPEGGVLSISLSLCNDQDTSRGFLQNQPLPPFLRLVVSDTGTGLKRDQIEKIFDPFVSYKRKGIGLGLAILFRILENHTANIRVISEVGKGSKFMVDFPLRQSGSAELKTGGDLLS